MQFFNQCLANAAVLPTLGWIQRQGAVNLGESFNGVKTLQHPGVSQCNSFYSGCRTCAVSSEMASDRPLAKRRRQEERDLTFLQVKNKDGRKCLFVDLGKKNKMLQRDDVTLPYLFLNL